MNRTGILRADVTVIEFEAEHCGLNDYIAHVGERLVIDRYPFPESWYTDIQEEKTAVEEMDERVKKATYILQSVGWGGSAQALSDGWQAVKAEKGIS